MRRQIIICDRCGEDITEEVSEECSVQFPKVAIDITLVSWFDCIDLCNECRKELREWVRPKENEDECI